MVDTNVVMMGRALEVLFGEMSGETCLQTFSDIPAIDQIVLVVPPTFGNLARSTEEKHALTTQVARVKVTNLVGDTSDPIIQ